MRGKEAEAGRCLRCAFLTEGPAEEQEWWSQGISSEERWASEGLAPMRAEVMEPRPGTVVLQGGGGVGTPLHPHSWEWPFRSTCPSHCGTAACAPPTPTGSRENY